MKVFLCLAVVHLCVNSVLVAGKGTGTGGGAAARPCPSRDRVREAVETACEYPSKLVLVSSPGEKQVDANNCNAEYEKVEWQQVPMIRYPDADPEKTYTFINVDPDPPSYENGQYYLHWLVSNIKGDDFAKGDLSKANHLQAYYGPAPPEGSGLHRYMFLAFEEGNGAEEVENPSRRTKFELAPWLQRQQGLCGPVAGIQFRTKF